jgi:cell division protein FtsA
MNDMSRRVLPPPMDPDEPSRPRGGRTGPFGVLDIGTTKIACLIGRIESDGRLRVLGFGWHRGRGVRAGGITDLDEAGKAIRACVGQAEDMADTRRRHRQPVLRPAGKPAVQRAMAGRRPRGG